MERLFNLSGFSKFSISVIFILIFAIFAVTIYIEYIFTKDANLATVTIASVAAFVPTITILVIMMFNEKKENIDLIERNIDAMIELTIPRMINNRFVGEPFDKKLKTEKYQLKCEVFHGSREPHAGYKVSFEDIEFEFTLIITLYRVTLFMFLPLIDNNKERIKSLEEACENLTNVGFNLSLEDVAGYTGGDRESFTVAFLRRDLTDRFSDLTLSPREQYMFAREITEWCRTIVRKLKYDKKDLEVIGVQFRRL